MKWTLAPRTVSLLIIVSVFLAALLARRLGQFQFLEFRAYDFLIQRQAKLPSSDPIVLVEMREDDIQSPTLDYPITDEKLAELLGILEQDRPAVIGLDIWRDIPVPKSGPHLQDFSEMLLSHTNIICIYTTEGIAPPPALAPYPERLGFNDNFPVDDGVERTTPKVRRSMLFAEAESGGRLWALPIRVAGVYLARQGLDVDVDASDARRLRLGRSEVRLLQPDDGPYVNADTAGGQILIDYKCPTNFTRYSVGEALAGKIPAGSLRDKIVLVGMNAPSVSDERVTPISRAQRGIELQGMTIHQLLRLAHGGGRPLRFWPDWEEDAWMLGWCLAGGVIGYGVRSPWRFISLILLGLLVLVGVTSQAFGAGWWIPVFAPVAGFLPAAALVTSYISFSEHRNRGQLMQLFSNQVSPDIARALWDQRHEFLAGNRPRSQKLTATVLFSDLKGFTSTSEGLEPAALMDWLNEYMEVMANEVMVHEGVVEKYIGDSIMAVFGVPVPRTAPEQIARDARNAVRCALAMERGMAKLNLIWQQRGLPACSTRIGIHTGALVAGSLGSLDRQEYTVLGDSVNTASRLESFGKDSTDPNLSDEGCRILISEATRTLLDEAFTVIPVGTMNLKGKSEKVMLYRVINKTSSEQGDTHEK